MIGTEVQSQLEELEHEKQAVWEKLLESKAGSMEEKHLQQRYVDVSRRIRRLKGV